MGGSLIDRRETQEAAEPVLGILQIRRCRRYRIPGGLRSSSGEYLFLFQELILTGGTPWELFISTAAGFIVGLIVNYVLSLTFVFRRKDNRGSGKSVAAFLIFTVVGVIGLGLTELIMYLGTELLHISYLIVKIVAAAIVLVWNYVGRKVLIFDRKGKIETK